MKTNLPKQDFSERVKKRVYRNNLPDSAKNGSITNGNKRFTQEDKIRIVVEGQSSSLTIGEFCIRERITPSAFYQWSQEFLHIENQKSDINTSNLNGFTDEEKFKIVIEGKSGETSIPEICKREDISHDIFLQWSQDFLDLRKKETPVLNAEKLAYQKNKSLFEKISNLKVFKYLENYIDFSNQNQLIISSSNSIELERVEEIESIINLQKINDIRYINKHFEIINSKLPVGGVFAGCLETFSARNSKKSVSKLPIVRDFYFFSEFLFKRIIPKLSFTKSFYFDITKGNDRLLSKAEGLGRLVSSGFKIMDFKSIDELIYFVVKKEKEPVFDANPSYGPIYKMPRLGKNGKIIKVYKFRTMHPYSEYLQDYVLKVNGYSETGKPAEDFRIPKWGKFMRKIWLDELPQLINFIKGDLKLVGIRPVSRRYFQDIPKEMQKLRLTQKPGCIPPYVALNREGNVMSVLQSEKDYLEEKIRNPYTTDTKYFFKAIYNIIFKHKRSA